MSTSAVSRLDLNLLHDCRLLELQYDLSSPRERVLTLVLEAPEELGPGRLRITARGVCYFHYTAWGHTHGAETLDAWDAGVSANTESELARTRAAGLNVPALGFTVTFHSGSHFELVCARLEHELLP